MSLAPTGQRKTLGEILVGDDLLAGVRQEGNHGDPLVIHGSGMRVTDTELGEGKEDRARGPSDSHTPEGAARDVGVT